MFHAVKEILFEGLVILIKCARRLAGDGASTPVTLQDVNRANAVPASDYLSSADDGASGAEADDRQNGARELHDDSQNGVSRQLRCAASD
jgi:hypothetical protein